MDKDFAVIESEQIPNRLSVAGGGDYDKIWIRDNVYVALAFLEADRTVDAAVIFGELGKIISKYEHILTLGVYPQSEAATLPPRFTVSGESVAGEWSNKQHDAVGAYLFGVGTLYAKDKSLVDNPLRNLCQKLITYLESCRYWEDEDNGMWEEPPALHASSLAACIRGIEMVSDFCSFNQQYHNLAKASLDALLPHESSRHAEDMALLSLIWPYGYKLPEIVTMVERHLLRERGVIRYPGDSYESEDQTEPQWVMGIPWLGIAHLELGNTDKAKAYLAQTEQLYTDNGLPESYAANNVACMHTPLGWSHALAIVLRAKLSRQK